LIVIIGRVGGACSLARTVGLYRSKAKRVPLSVFPQRLEQSGIKRDRAAFAALGLTLADGQELPLQVDLIPPQGPNLAIPQPGIQTQHQCWVDRR
jgi:hypothetical protein